MTAKIGQIALFAGKAGLPRRPCHKFHKSPALTPKTEEKWIGRQIKAPRHKADLGDNADGYI
jgi:hypothetical protein